MRVLSLLLTLAAVAVSSVSADVYYVVGQTNSQTWNIASPNVTNTPVANPAITVRPGETISFSITQVFAIHPFGFSTVATDRVVEALSFASTSSTADGSACDLTGGANTYKKNATNGDCDIILEIPSNATVGTIWYYKCLNHGGMKGTITVVAAGTTAPPSGTTAPPSGTTAPPSGTTAPPSGTTAPPSGTTAPPSGTTAPPSGTTAPPVIDTAVSKFFITGNVNASAYTVAIGGTANAVNNLPLTITTGTRVSFTITKAMVNHPFGFSPTANGSLTAVPGVNFVNCDTRTANTYVAVSDTIPCVITMEAPAAGTSLWYRCSNHVDMGARITVVAKSAASALVMSFATIVLAAITAIIVA